MFLATRPYDNHGVIYMCPGEGQLAGEIQREGIQITSPLSILFCVKSSYPLIYCRFSIYLAIHWLVIHLEALL